MNYPPNPNRLNLIAPMSIVSYLATGTDPGVYKADHIWVPFELGAVHPPLVLTGLEWATSDVIMKLWVRAALAPPDARVFITVNENIVADLWEEDGEDCAQYPYERATIVTIWKGDWNRWVPDGLVSIQAFAGNVVAGECADSFLKMHLEYPYEPADAGVPRPPYPALASFQHTMVAGKWEPRGKPHRHRAEYVFDRRNGCLVICNESHFWGDDVPKVCCSGGGVSPAVETETRPGGGCFESRCIGEIGGVPVRLMADNACALL